MKQIVNVCQLCGSKRNVLFDQRIVRGINISNYLCKYCGLVYQSPRMNEKEINKFYESEYRRLYQGGQEGPAAKEITVQRARAESLISFFSAKVNNISRYLDIGCSTGLLLSTFREHYSCQTVGIEPGNAFRNYATQQGLKVYSSLEKLLQAKESLFDLISILHVLEHLPDPITVLIQLRQSFLTPDGWLLIEVPNLYAHDCFEIAHLFSFSERTLTQILKKAGYEITRKERHGRPRSKIIPYYITVLAHPSHSLGLTFSLRPEKQVAFKRQLGLLRRRILTRLFPQKAWIELS